MCGYLSERKEGSVYNEGFVVGMGVYQLKGIFG